MRNVSDKSCRENKNILCLVSPPSPENRVVYDIMKNAIFSVGATHTHTHTHTHTLRICNIYCFYTATVVTRTRLNFTLYLHCLSNYSSPHPAFPHSVSDFYPSLLHPSLPFFFPLLLGPFLSPFPFNSYFAPQFPSDATGRSCARREATSRFS